MFMNYKIIALQMIPKETEIKLSIQSRMETLLKEYEHLLTKEYTQDNEHKTDLLLLLSKIESINTEYTNFQRSLISLFKAKKLSAEEFSRNITITYGDDKKELPTRLIWVAYDIKKTLRGIDILEKIKDTKQEDILKNDSDLLDNISLGGTNSKGVYNILGHKDYIAKEINSIDDAVLLINYANSIKSPRIMKTVQYIEINNRHFVIQKKASGTNLHSLNSNEIEKITTLQKNNFLADLEELRAIGLNIDISGNKANYFYDPNLGIQIIDLGIGIMCDNETILSTLRLK